MKSIMLFVHDDHGEEARLQAALDLARTLNGHLTCVQATPYSAYILMDSFGGVYGVPGLLRKVTEQQDAAQARLEERLRREGVDWDWIREDGDGAQVIVARSRLADIIVLSQGLSGRDQRNQPLDLVADVVMHARSPVFAVPSRGGGIDCGGPALVAWNGSFEAAQALRAAVPMLRLASAVKIVTVAENDLDFPASEASTYLSRHGIGSQLVDWSRGGPVDDALRSAAGEFDAAYLVLGAYSHPRIRERVLGGVTQSLLDDSPVPLFLAH